MALIECADLYHTYLKGTPLEEVVKLIMATVANAQAIHGLVSCAEWTGVMLSTLLEEAGIDPKAKWLVAEGADSLALSRSVPIAKALDISVVPLAATEAYEAVQRGTVDGALFPWEAMESFRLNDLLKAHLEIPGGLLAASFVIVANKQAMEKLSPANRAALLKASSEAGSALFGKAWDAADEKARKDAKDRSQAIESLAPAELDRWRPRLKFVTDEWLKKAGEKGFDGQKMLDDFRAMVKAAQS